MQRRRRRLLDELVQVLVRLEQQLERVLVELVLVLLLVLKKRKEWNGGGGISAGPKEKELLAQGKPSFHTNRWLRRQQGNQSRIGLMITAS